MWSITSIFFYIYSLNLLNKIELREKRSVIALEKFDQSDPICLLHQIGVFAFTESLHGLCI